MSRYSTSAKNDGSMEHPFFGFVQVSSAPLRDALDQLGAMIGFPKLCASPSEIAGAVTSD
jgi:hypothetical protein